MSAFDVAWDYLIKASFKMSPEKEEYYRKLQEILAALDQSTQSRFRRETPNMMGMMMTDEERELTEGPEETRNPLPSTYWQTYGAGSSPNYKGE